MRETFQTISPQEAKEMIDTSSVTILDVREPMEFCSGHIPNAYNLPVGSVRRQAADALPDQAATILVYCLSGMRSATACNILTELGYTNVYDFGGIASWPYEIEP
ncbi:MAG: rhodanese-like domain-containing protein [Butyricicoccus pullicaecorum]|nr:rhodanese-like domain-containing protein [Butyricicoccus pullicaecorum]